MLLFCRRGGTILLETILIQAARAEKSIFKEYFEKEEHEFRNQDLVVLGLFIEMINKTKSLNLLLEHNMTSGTDSLGRSIFEIFVYLKFILEKDTKNRAMSFLLKENLRERNFLKIMKGHDRESRETRKVLGITLQHILKEEAKYNDSHKEAEWKERYKSIHRNLDKLPKNWYDFDGKTNSFYALCRKMNYIGYYNTVFRLLSADTHSTDIARNFHIEDDYIAILREKDIGQSVEPIVQFCLYEIMMDVLFFYKLTELRKEVNKSLRLNRNLNTSN